ncbi:MAG: hypothetical protein JEZ06_00535 [Anaerolineaceae bacterium]|nr:hypothetical protein [Anaerolineaceae bacterium]
MQKIVQLISSRKFWTSLVGIIVLLLPVFGIEEEIDSEAFIGVIMITISYVVGVAIDPGQYKPSLKKVLGLLQSHKFWGYLIGMVVNVLTILGVNTGIPEDKIIELMLLLSGLVVSKGIEDRVKLQFVSG